MACEAGASTAIPCSSKFAPPYPGGKLHVALPRFAEYQARAARGAVNFADRHSADAYIGVALGFTDCEQSFGLSLDPVRRYR